MGCKIRNPYLPTKYSNLRLLWAQARPNWTIEDWKDVITKSQLWINLKFCCEMEKFHQPHGSTVPNCFVSTFLAGGGGLRLWGMCSWRILGFVWICWNSMIFQQLFPTHCRIHAMNNMNALRAKRSPNPYSYDVLNNVAGLCISRLLMCSIPMEIKSV